LKQKIRLLFVIVISVLVFLSDGPAQAKEALVFNNNALLKITTLALSQYLSDDLSHYEIAKADLNGDGADEYIAKTIPCQPDKQFCAYHILGLAGDQIFDLGALEAKYLMVSDESHYGVRDILAYQNPYNDYDPTIYRWAPAQSRYILSEGAPDDVKNVEK